MQGEIIKIYVLIFIIDLFLITNINLDDFICNVMSVILNGM